MREPNSGSISIYFLNLVLKGKFAQIHSFYLQTRDGGVLVPNKRETYKPGVTDKTVTKVLAGKHPSEKKPW